MTKATYIFNKYAQSAAKGLAITLENMATAAKVAPKQSKITASFLKAKKALKGPEAPLTGSLKEYYESIPEGKLDDFIRSGATAKYWKQTEYPKLTSIPDQSFHTWAENYYPQKFLNRGK